MTEDLATRIYEGSGPTQTHAILAAAMGREPLTTARYVGRAVCTSDGYLMCSFVGEDGDHHMGAFVGSYGDLEQNLIRLGKHLGLTAEEKLELGDLVDGWIATDYR